MNALDMLLDIEYFLLLTFLFSSFYIINVWLLKYQIINLSNQTNEVFNELFQIFIGELLVNYW